MFVKTATWTTGIVAAAVLLAVPAFANDFASQIVGVWKATELVQKEASTDKEVAKSAIAQAQQQKDPCAKAMEQTCSPQRKPAAIELQRVIDICYQFLQQQQVRDLGSADSRRSKEVAENLVLMICEGKLPARK